MGHNRLLPLELVTWVRSLLGEMASEGSDIAVRGIDKANVVVVADNFNPSILSQVWLVKHGIVDEDAIGEGSIFVPPELVRVTTGDFTIQALPERLEFTLSDPGGDAQALVEGKVGVIVDLLPHTPYRAIGFNFHWTATTDILNSFASDLRRVFVRDDSPFAEYFAESDARVGAYFSKDILGFRLRLTVTPMQGEREGSPFEGLRFHFNFHRGLEPDTAVEEIHNALRSWTEARDISQAIFDSTTGWLSNDEC